MSIILPKEQTFIYNIFQNTKNTRVNHFSRVSFNKLGRAYLMKNF